MNYLHASKTILKRGLADLYNAKVNQQIKLCYKNPTHFSGGSMSTVELCNDYSPTKKDINIILSRLLERDYNFYSNLSNIVLYLNKV